MGPIVRLLKSAGAKEVSSRARETRAATNSAHSVAIGSLLHTKPVWALDTFAPECLTIQFLRFEPFNWQNKAVLDLTVAKVEAICVCNASLKLMKYARVCKVHIRIASPPLKYPCYMGINIPTKDELIANRLPTEKLTEYLGNFWEVCHAVALLFWGTAGGTWDQWRFFFFSRYALVALCFHRCPCILRPRELGLLGSQTCCPPSTCQFSIDSPSRYTSVPICLVCILPCCCVVIQTSVFLSRCRQCRVFICGRFSQGCTARYWEERGWKCRALHGLLDW